VCEDLGINKNIAEASCDVIDDDSVVEEEVFCKIESHLGDRDNDPRTP